VHGFEQRCLSCVVVANDDIQAGRELEGEVLEGAVVLDDDLLEQR
jgi:hypothetical protein